MKLIKISSSIIGVLLCVVSFQAAALSVGVSPGTECEAYNENQNYVQKWGGNYVSYSAGTDAFCPVQRDTFVGETLTMTFNVYQSGSSTSTCTLYSRYQSGSTYSYSTSSTSAVNTVNYLSLSTYVPSNGNAYVFCDLGYANRIVQYRYSGS